METEISSNLYGSVGLDAGFTLPYIYMALLIYMYTVPTYLKQAIQQMHSSRDNELTFLIILDFIDRIQYTCLFQL